MINVPAEVFQLLAMVMGLCALLAPAAWLADRFGPKDGEL